MRDTIVRYAREDHALILTCASVPYVVDRSPRIGTTQDATRSRAERSDVRGYGGGGVIDAARP